MIRKLSVLMALGLASALLSAPAKADGDGPGFNGPGRGPGPGGFFPRPSQCVQDCRSAARDCRDTAFENLKSCAQTTCSTQVQAARDACKSDPTSDACKTAYAAAVACLQPCRDALKTDTDECKTTLDACVSACPTPTPTPTPGPQKDPTCVAGCRSDLHTCQGTAGDDVGACYQACQPLAATARQTCMGSRWSADCRTAIQAVNDCLRACNKQLQSDVRDCLNTATTCAQACPTVAPQ